MHPLVPMKPWRKVEFISVERTGPQGGRYQMLKLECGHLKAWSLPLLVRPFPRPYRPTPSRVRCLFCPESR